MWGKMTASNHVGHALMASDAPLATLPHVNWSNLELLPFGIVILDESGTVLYYNSREEQIAGRRRNDVLGKNFFRDVAPCTQVAEFYGEFVEIMSGRRSSAEFAFTFPFEARARDVEISIMPFRSDDQRLCLVTVRDLTESEALRDRIVTSTRFGEVGEVASGVAHNLNNVLMAIGTWAAVLQREVKSEGRAATAVAEIIRAVADGRHIVSRVRQSVVGQSSLESPLLVDLNEVIRRAVQIAEVRLNTADEPNATCRVRLSLAEPPPFIRGTATEIREVFVNLLNNAVDSRASVVVVSTLVVGSVVNITLDDNGAGMAEETRNRLFRPLFTTKGKEGTGLGLSSSLAIVRRYGGDISVETRLGTGSKFTITLPLANA
jgi:photoactive yellow protein